LQPNPIDSSKATCSFREGKVWISFTSVVGSRLARTLICTVGRPRNSRPTEKRNYRRWSRIARRMAVTSIRLLIRNGIRLFSCARRLSDLRLICPSRCVLFNSQVLETRMEPGPTKGRENRRYQFHRRGSYCVRQLGMPSHPQLRMLFKAVIQRVSSRPECPLRICFPQPLLFMLCWIQVLRFN